MNITKTLENEQMTFAIEGRLDTNTAPMLEEALKELPKEVKTLIFDFEKLAYVSSAGLRVLLQTAKLFDERGQFEIIHVNEDIMDVFEITGFTEILTIK